MTSPIPIKNRRELLADRRLIAKRSGGTDWRLHHPTPRELVPHLENREGFTYRYMTVFRDGPVYRMYYAMVSAGRRGGEEALARKNRERICYAESKDGIDWETPDLGLIEDEDASRGNVVWMEEGPGRIGVSGFSVFKDQNPACPKEQRYKAVAEAGPLGKKILGHNGLLAFGSPDGLRWAMLSSEAVMTGGLGWGNFDTQNLAFWDAVNREYRLYRRDVFSEGPTGCMRDVLTATSKDFLTWSKPERLRYSEAFPDQLYTNNVLPYFRAPHLFVGFPVRYVERTWSASIADLPERSRREALIRKAGASPKAVPTTEAGGQRIGTALTDVLFMISRNGRDFQRWDEAFIRPGLRPIDNWFYPDNFPAWGLVTTPSAIAGAPEELSFYVTEGGRREDLSNVCRRYTLRVDGFVSLHAGRAGGGAVTVPLVFEGGELEINFSASAVGSIRVEIQSEEGWPLPGFELENCVEVLGDDLGRRVRWKGEPDLGNLSGQSVRLHFILLDADLYSFCFQ